VPGLLKRVGCSQVDKKVDGIDKQGATWYTYKMSGLKRSGWKGLAMKIRNTKGPRY
jgi:hypothetical protein